MKGNFFAFEKRVAELGTAIKILNEKIDALDHKIDLVCRPVKTCTNSDIENIKALMEHGLSCKEIASFLQISESRLNNLLMQMVSVGEDDYYD